MNILTNKSLTFFSLLIISTLGSLYGCSLYHVNSEYSSNQYYHSKESGKDVIYLEKIDRPHEILGTVIVNAERRQDIDKIIEKMKYEAAMLGGDAITDIRTDATGSWKKLPAQQLIGNAYIRANFSATVVVFK